MNNLCYKVVNKTKKMILMKVQLVLIHDPNTH